MAEFTAQDVQALRRATGVGMLDAKRALEACHGDHEEAVQWLRVQGLAGAAKREDREASDGAVAIVKDGQVAAMVELKCETDFVAKSEEFVTLADEIAASVAAKGEAAVGDATSEVDRLRTVLKEHISVGRVVRIEAAPDDVLDTYLHQQAGRGINGVIVVLRGATRDLAHDVAVHVAFGRPEYLRREDVPADLVASERATLEEISRNEGKPEAALPKIIEGRMNGWFKERCLLEQPYVRDEKVSVGSLLGSAEIVEYAQVVIGT
ncbi:MAG: translation elongation factor Ts [Actinomycetota bacterium]|nr:translation elongation factor Ts [Actinomycetota bacterium]